MVCLGSTGDNYRNGTKALLKVLKMSNDAYRASSVPETLINSHELELKAHLQGLSSQLLLSDIAIYLIFYI